jgi:hypothetical protein
MVTPFAILMSADGFDLAILAIVGSKTQSTGKERK